MRKLLGLISIFALVGVAAGANGAGATPPSGPPPDVKEYGRAQQVEGGKVVASSGYDVQHTTYTLAPGGDTGWRNGPGSTTLALTKGALKIEQASGCATRALTAGSAIVLPAGKFRLQNTDKEPAEILANFTNLPSGGGAPLDGEAGSAPDCAGFAAAAVANGLSADKTFRGDPTAYYNQVHAGHHGSDGYASSEIPVEVDKDAVMMTFVLQPGFSTGWFAHTPHVAIITKGSWAFFEARDGKCEKVEEYLTSRYTEGLDLNAAIKLAVEAMGEDSTPARVIPADDLEVAVLDRTRTLTRKFKRLPTEAVAQALT